MNILMISKDGAIFSDGSSVQKRMRSYGTLCDELHIVVLLKKSTYRKVVRTRKISENVHIYSTPISFMPVWLWQGYLLCRNIIGSKKDWLITAQDPFESGLMGYFVHKKHASRFQVQVHTDFLNSFFWRESFKNKVRVVLGKWLVRRADSIRVVSRRIERSLERIRKSETPVYVLPIFAASGEIQQRKQETSLRDRYGEHDFIVLMASRLTREKNIPLALSVMRDVVRGFPRALLLIVGDGPEKMHIVSLSTKYGLQKNVIIEPWSSNISAYYKIADCFLLTSNYEGYGRTVIEAMRASVPVIMTNVGIAGEVVQNGKNGMVVPVGDDRALYDVAMEFIGNTEKRKLLGKKGLRSLYEFPNQEAYLGAIKESFTI